MKVLDLQCPASHVFEGWFGSEDDFQSQLARGLVECPVCGDKQVSKKLTAARLNLGAGRAQEAGAAPSGATSGGASGPAAPPAAAPAPAEGMPVALQAAWMKAVRHVMANTEDVGERFAQEARRIHYGESEERGIRGQASPEETRELLEEGIGVLPLPVPKGMKGPLQ
jgi:hypothetical protein